MNNMNRLFKSGLMLGVALSGTVVFADVVSYSGDLPIGGGEFSINNSGSIVLTQFDSSLGTLNSISLTLSGHITTTQRFENGDDSGGTVFVPSTGTFTLTRPDTSSLVVVLPTITQGEAVGAFDGFNDFAGVSGRSYAPASTSLSNSVLYSAGTTPGTWTSDEALFTGVGTISLPVSSSGNSNGGVGTTVANLTLGVINFKGGATAQVTYDYTPAEVPEASTYGSIGAVAIVGFLGYRRSRKGATTAA